jgi:putative sigma-54 modulation protein
VTFEFAARNTHLDPDLRKEAEERLRKAAKFLEEPVEARVVIEVEKHRHVAEIHVSHRHGVIQAREETPAAMRDALQMAVEKVEKQARRSRKRFMDRRRRAARAAENNGHWPLAVVEPESLRSGPPRIILSDRLEVKPMEIEDAALGLESSAHGFVVFFDTSSSRLSVLYRRTDGNYGLIAPDL